MRVTSTAPSARASDGDDDALADDQINKMQPEPGPELPGQMVSELYLIERHLLHAYVHSMPIRQHLWGTVTIDRTDCLAFRVLCADYRTTTAGRQAQTQSEN